jgi:ligand-binding sensor domain-containing protein/signal transduction histidine kinase
MISIIFRMVFIIRLRSWCRNLNIYRDHRMRRFLLVCLASLLLGEGNRRLFALDGKRSITQYVYAAWGVDKGYTGGAVYAIAQSSDGYLWLGTERGLVRFDGSEFTPVRAPLGRRKTPGAVRGLIEDSEGNLWVRLDGPQLLRYRDGVFEDAVSKFALFDSLFTAVSKDSRGNLLLWGTRNGLLRFHGQHFEQILQPHSFEGMAYSLAESPSGVLWLGTRDSGLYRVENGGSTQVVSDAPLRSINALAPSEHGGVWIGSDSGLHLWEDGRLIPLDLPAELRKDRIFTIVRDQDRNLWIGTDTGLYRIDPERRIVTGLHQNAGDTRISSIFEDSEGDLWFAGAHAIERLRDGMFTSFSSRQTALNEIGGPVYVDNAARTWFAPTSGGIFVIEKDAVRRITIPSLGNDVIYSIDGVGDELWLGRQRGGLTELTRHGSQWLARTFTQKDGLAENSVYTVTYGRDGTVWAGTVSGGVSALRKGKFQTYTINSGLPSNAIFSSLEAADGKMWFATAGGLVSFDGQQWMTYQSADTGPPLNVRTIFEDSSHVLWVGTPHGLARFNEGQIEPLRALPQVLNEEILSIGQDPQGFLWIVTDQHVLRMDPKALLAGGLKNEDIVSFNTDDGLIETEGVRRHRSLVSDSSGRIWLSFLHSLAVADVSAAEAYHQPVRVRIDSIATEGASSQSKRIQDLPSGTRSITFRYAGTNLAMPQRTNFRYRLDDLDHTWSEGSSSRQVVFTPLSPGNYRFRMMASNAFGIWNGPENDIAFHVRPEFWQTWYFRVLSVLAIAVLAIVLYRIRLIEVTNQLDRRFQDRLAERSRIAQDLHDTLLQGVISASMQLDVAQDDLPEDSPSRFKLGRILQQMRQVTVEGREALRGLRTIDNSTSLEIAFKRLTTELDPFPPSESVFYVEGQTRALKMVVFEEVYRIGREAYINAIAHARASRIEIAVDYGQREFRLLVRDNGCGIDAGTLKNGREGHWGLAGMRERAEAIGSILAISPGAQGGTDVELRIPAAIAYSLASSERIHWRWSIQKFYSKPKKGRQL